MARRHSRQVKWHRMRGKSRHAGKENEKLRKLDCDTRVFEYMNQLSRAWGERSELLIEWERILFAE